MARLLSSSFVDSQYYLRRITPLIHVFEPRAVPCRPRTIGLDMICALLIEAQFGAWAGSGDRSRHALVTSNDYLPDKLKASASGVSAVGRSIVDLPLTCLEPGAGKRSSRYVVPCGGVMGHQRMSCTKKCGISTLAKIDTKPN